MSEPADWWNPKNHGPRKSPLPRGHAGTPGKGPEGETCGSCEHLYRRTMGKTYLKCELARWKWTGGGKSDVRARDPACEKWSPDPVRLRPSTGGR